MKYIDADRLRARIEQLLEFDGTVKTDYYIGKRDAELVILSFLDSLQQEQPEVDLEQFDKDVTKIWGRCAAEPNDSIACLHIETFNEVARHFYELGCRRTAEMYDDIEYNRQMAEEKQPVEGLEEEITEHDIVVKAKEIANECAKNHSPAMGMFFAACKMAHWIKTKIPSRPKISGNSLEEEIQNCIYNHFFDLDGIAIAGSTAYATVDDIAYIARHFAEWGARHSINWGDVQLLDTFILELSREEKDGTDWGDSEKFYTEVLRRFHEFNDKKISEIVAEWGAEHARKEE